MQRHLKHKLNIYDQGGFSLIELLVVVVILGILAAVTVPNMRTWQVHSRVNRDARIVLGVLQQARMEAVKRNEFVSVLFSNSTTTTPHYTVFFDDNANRVFDAAEDEIFVSNNFTYADHTAGFSIPQTTAVIFNSRGLPSSSTVSSNFVIGNITFSNQVDNYTKQVVVSRSGQISIQ